MRPVRSRVLERHQHPRAIGEAVGEPVRLGAEHAAYRHRCVADRERAADADAKPLEQRLLGDDHPGLPPKSTRVFRLGDHHLAIEGIGAVDGLHFDQRALAALDPRHGAQARRFRHLAFVVERRALLFARAPVHALEGQIAADEQTALPGESLVERRAERAD